MYTTAQTARMLGVTDTSVRRYTHDYKDHLSETATSQKRRQFTDRDITILKAAQRFAGEGHTKVEINRLLFDAELSTQDTGKALQNYGEIIASVTTLRSHLDNTADLTQETAKQLRETTESQKANAARFNAWLLILSTIVLVLFVLVIVLLIRG